MIEISRTEQATAIAVGLGTYFLFDHFHLIPGSYEAGRIVAQATVGLGGGTVILVWSFIAKKKKDRDDPP